MVVTGRQDNVVCLTGPQFMCRVDMANVFAIDGNASAAAAILIGAAWKAMESFGCRQNIRMDQE